MIFYMLLYLTTIVEAKKLLVFYVDSFPGSELHRYSKLSAFRAFESNGVWSDYLRGVYPTQSIPNQWSLLTGSLPVHHGIVSDYFYSRSIGGYFNGGARSSDYDERWWTQRQPIHTIAHSHGVRVASFYWPFLCNITIDSIDVCVPPMTDGRTITNKTMAKVLESTKRHDLTMVYYDAIRKAAERDGYNVLEDVASNNSPISILNSLLDMLVAFVQTQPDLNVIVLSGHGMTQVSKTDQRFLEDYIDMQLLNITIGCGALKHLIPANGRMGKVIEILTDQNPIPNVKLQRTDSRVAARRIRDHYQYHLSDQIPDLFLEAELGFNIRTNTPGKQVPEASPADNRKVLSGYNNQYPHMLGLFYAMGPAFNSGQRMPRVNLIDVHLLMCDILQIDCHDHQNDANFTDISAVLRNPMFYVAKTNHVTTGRANENHGREHSTIFVLLSILVSIWLTR